MAGAVGAALVLRGRHRTGRGVAALTFAIRLAGPASARPDDVFDQPVAAECGDWPSG
jgi:hypothetical protein